MYLIMIKHLTGDSECREPPYPDTIEHIFPGGTDHRLDSPGHCENIMNGNVTEMGVATSGSYWTQVFAKPK